MSNPFLESPRFPGCPSFGFLFRPRYLTEKIGNAGGGELRYDMWQYPLHDCQVTVGPRMDDEIDQVLEFFHAVKGEYVGFRFKNYGEFKTCRPSQDPAATDQPMLATDSSDEEYQLIKRYTAGVRTQDRFILKPIAATVVIADGGSPVDSSDYTLDETTGLVSFSVPVTDPTWGGQFDVPMRFQGDFPTSIIARKAYSVSFMLEELRVPGESES